MTGKLARIGIVLVISLALIGAGSVLVAASLSDDPSVDSANSTIEDGADVEIDDLSGNTTFAVLTDDGDDIDTAEVEIELADDDRNHTVYEADSEADGYSVTEDINAANDTQHEWEIDNEEFADAPIEFDGDVNLDFTATFADGDSEGEVNGTFTLNNTGDRASILVDSDSVDDDDVGSDVTTETITPNFVQRFVFGTEDRDVYHLDASPAINENGTDVEVHIADDDAAEAFEDQLPDDEGLFSDATLDSEDRIYELSVLHDGHVGALFLEDADSTFVDTDDDTHVVYDDDDDVFTLTTGDDYEDRQEIVLHVGSHAPTFQGMAGVDDYPAAMLEDIGFQQARQTFNAQVAVQLFVFGIPGTAAIGVLVAVPLVIGVRRRGDL